jgi:hypothetical protein
MPDPPPISTAEFSDRYCRTCAYDLRASENRCPECGRPFDPANPRTYRRLPPSAALWWLTRLLIAVFILALPPALTLGWLWQGWHEEQQALAAVNRGPIGMNLVQPGVMVMKIDSRYPSLQKLLPQRLAYLGDRAAVVESDVAIDADIARLVHFKHIRSFAPRIMMGWNLVFLVGAPGDDSTELVELSKLSTDLQLSKWLQHAVSRTLHWPTDRITDAGLKYLAPMTEMQELWLPQTPITNAGLAYLSGMTQLTTLDLSQAAITDAGLAHLAQMTQMEYLFMWHTKITGAGLAHLSHMTKLKCVILCGNPLTDAAVEPLAAHSSLIFLDLRRTGLSEAGLSRLRVALPSTTIAQ